MKNIEIILKKYNPKTNQYDTYVTINVPINLVRIKHNRIKFRAQVGGFYLYEYTLDNINHRVYSVSPDLFEDIT